MSQVKTGDEQELRALARGETYIAGNFYVGLCSETFDKALTLAAITTEPTIGVGGYARQVIERSALGWPTVEEVSGVMRVVSKIITFSAVGADFDKDFTKMFLTDVASGVGTLIAVSGGLTVPLLVTDGTSWSAQFSWYAK